MDLSLRAFPKDLFLLIPKSEIQGLSDSVCAAYTPPIVLTINSDNLYFPKAGTMTPMPNTIWQVPLEGTGDC